MKKLLVFAGAAWLLLIVLAGSPHERASLWHSSGEEKREQWNMFTWEEQDYVSVASVLEQRALATFLENCSIT